MFFYFFIFLNQFHCNHCCVWPGFNEGSPLSSTLNTEYCSSRSSTYCLVMGITKIVVYSVCRSPTYWLFWVGWYIFMFKNVFLSRSNLLWLSHLLTNKPGFGQMDCGKGDATDLQSNRTESFCSPCQRSSSVPSPSVQQSIPRSAWRHSEPPTNLQ